VPLPQLAIGLLGTPTNIEGQERELVFGDARNRPPQDFSRVKLALDAEMERLAKREGRSIAPWRIHDLRRSCASGMQAIAVRHEVIEKALNHSGGLYSGVSGTYQRAELMPERREALQRWAAHVEGLVSSDKPNNVAELLRRRR
jgi:hypothetical protein